MAFTLILKNYCIVKYSHVCLTNNRRDFLHNTHTKPYKHFIYPNRSRSKLTLILVQEFSCQQIAICPTDLLMHIIFLFSCNRILDKVLEIGHRFDEWYVLVCLAILLQAKWCGNACASWTSYDNRYGTSAGFHIVVIPQNGFFLKSRSLGLDVGTV